MATTDARVLSTAGPLVVCTRNSRYFAAASDPGHAVYLTGSHVNNNFHDGLGPGRDCAESPEAIDFDAYLGFLDAHGHNFVRLWRWEQFKGYLPPADVHLCMSPQPWARTGPGTATDGRPRFDLTTFDTAYFDRLRRRVAAAERAGIYVSVMLFEGFSLHLTETPDNIAGHPFHRANNVNDVSIESIVDYQVLPLPPNVQELQEAYIRRVVDTVHDLPNVLFEVANESSGASANQVVMPDGMTLDTPIGDSTTWQYWVIDLVRSYEAKRGYASHPIGMTFLYPVDDQRAANDPLWASAADWISPGFDDGEMPVDSRWRLDPPPADGIKVVISDTDHYSPMDCDALWAWASFVRGHNPILYDLGIVAGVDATGPATWAPPYAALEPARAALGDTRALAQRVDLAAMEPHGELASTGFALVQPGREYVVLQPRTTGRDTIDLEVLPGVYSVRWYDIDARREQAADIITVQEPTTVALRSPFPADTNVVVELTA